MNRLPLGFSASLTVQKPEYIWEITPDTSLESGRPEIYVQSFPPGSGKWQVSNEGGGTPRWRGDGREIYFASLRGVYASSVASKGNGLVFGVPQKLFDNADQG